MKAKHSAGPWEVQGDLTQQLYYVHGANAVCDMRKPQGFSCSPAEIEANARLISAAPDLLAICEEIYEDLDNRYDVDEESGTGHQKESPYSGAGEHLRKLRQAIAKATKAVTHETR